jgi:predicted neutral ceramidase superfamily lipid hydrolase
MNAGHQVELYRINNYFTGDLARDLYRFAAECRVSEQQLNSEYRTLTQRAFEKEDGPWEQYGQSFADFCWDFVARVLVRDVGKLDDIECVVGTNAEAVHYLVDHLRIRNGSAIAIVPEIRATA